MPYFAPEAHIPITSWRSEVGGNKGETRDPDGNGAARGEEVLAVSNSLLHNPTDTQNEAEVQRQNRVVDECEVHGIVGP